MPPRLFDAVKALREKTDEVIVGYSRGKDAQVVLDLCVKLFRRVEAFHMHLVPDLSFVEQGLTCAERKYGIKIDRVPHFSLSDMYGTGTYRFNARAVPKIGIRDIQARQSERTGIKWHATGEKACDSLQRRGMMSAWGKVDEKRHLGYPLADWGHRQVYQYLKMHRIPLAADYGFLGRSFSTTLDGETLSRIEEHYPHDFAKIEAAFPLCGAALFRYRAARAAQAADV